MIAKLEVSDKNDMEGSSLKASLLKIDTSVLEIYIVDPKNIYFCPLFRDDVRAPIPQTQEVLIDEAPAYGILLCI